MEASLLTAVLWGGLAAASLLIGYSLSRRRLSMRTVGLVMGLGAGALIGAIAYELIPESSSSSSRARCWCVPSAPSPTSLRIGRLTPHGGGAHKGTRGW